MSVLSKFREYFGFGTEEPNPHYVVPPTLDERLNMAAVDRCYAFDLLGDVIETLRDSAQAEAEVAEEAARRADLAAMRGREDGERAIARGNASALYYNHMAYGAQENANGDATAVQALSRLVAQEDQ